MSATALPALGKMVGHSLKGKLVVILWNHLSSSLGWTKRSDG